MQFLPLSSGSIEDFVKKRAIGLRLFLLLRRQFLPFLDTFLVGSGFKDLYFFFCLPLGEVPFLVSAAPRLGRLLLRFGERFAAVHVLHVEVGLFLRL